jgi:hypothetical protein
MADGLRLTDTLGQAAGSQHLWDLDTVFSGDVAQSLPTRGLSRDDYDWCLAYF